MIERGTEEFLSRYSGEGGSPIFFDENFFDDETESTKESFELIVYSGCLEFRFHVSSNTGSVTHNYQVDDVAEPGSHSPVVFYDRSEHIQTSVIPSLSCVHLQESLVTEQLFAYARFLAPTLSEGDLLDGTFRHNPDYEYLDPGYDAEVALIIGSLVTDVFSMFKAFECECAAISKKALSERSETFRFN